MAGMSDVAHRWAHAHEGSRFSAGNISHEGSCYNSYETTVAKWYDRPCGRVFLLSSESFSTSTARHISTAYRAAYGAHVFSVPFVMVGWNGWATRVKLVAEMHAGNLAHLASRARDALARASRARVYGAQWVADAQGAARAAYAYASAFDLDASAIDRAAADAGVNLRALADAVPADVVRVVAPSPADARAAWRAGRRLSSRTLGPIMLRATPDGVRTSLGVTMALPTARALWQAWRAGRDLVGQAFGGYTVLRVTAGALTIGCHTLPRAECDAFAVVAGWIAADDVDDAARRIVAEMRPSEVTA